VNKQNTRSPNQILEEEIKKWGIPYLHPYQELLIHQILLADGFFGSDQAREEPKSRIAVLPTGFGKTLCFSVPIGLLKGITLIIYPLRSLLFDQYQRFTSAGQKAGLLYGGQNTQEREELFTSLSETGPHLILATLETLLSQTILKRLKNFYVSHLVYDEAHVIHQWGRSFRPAYLQIPQIQEALNPGQISAFTATADEEIWKELENTLNSPLKREIQVSPNKDNLSYRFFFSRNPELSLQVLLQAEPAKLEFPILIFLRNRKLCEKLARVLNMGTKFEVKFYHAGLNHAEKTACEAWFRNSKKAILLATNAYGMGVDHPGIRTVVHLNLPDSMAAYVQEAGRAGRDGKPALALTIQDSRCMPQVSSLQKLLNPEFCRRTSILEAFGQGPEYCTNCDVCNSDVWEQSPEEQRLLEFIKKYTGQYTKQECIQEIKKVLPSTLSIKRKALEKIIEDLKNDKLVKKSFWPLSFGALRIITRPSKSSQ